MAELEVVGEDLVLRLTTFEKIAALHRDLRFPISAISSVEVVDDPYALVKGFRAAGLSIPRRAAIGTFRRMAATRFIVLKGRQPAVQITFTRGAPADLVIGDPQAQAVADRLRAELGR